MLIYRCDVLCKSSRNPMQDSINIRENYTVRQFFLLIATLYLVKVWDESLKSSQFVTDEVW